MLGELGVRRSFVLFFFSGGVGQLVDGEQLAADDLQSAEVLQFVLGHRRRLRHTEYQDISYYCLKKREKKIKGCELLPCWPSLENMMV